MSNPEQGKIIYTKFGDFGFIPLQMLKDKNVTFNMMKVYVVLCFHQRGKEFCYPSIKTIMEETGMSRSAVISATNKLEAFKWIIKDRSNIGGVNHYTCLTKTESIEFTKNDKRKENKHNTNQSQKMRPVPVSNNETTPVSLNETLIDNLKENSKIIIKWASPKLEDEMIDRNKQKELVSLIASKSSLVRPWGIAGKWCKRFGPDLCAEILERLPDMSGRMGRDFICYAEKALQNEWIKRNPQGRDQVLAGLSEMIGR
jgi:DNA-binding transcriptional regulator GbsR (MarR family)